MDYLHAFLVSNGDDTYQHEKNSLVEHPTYAIKVFEKKNATFITKGKGKPQYIDNEDNKHVIESV